VAAVKAGASFKISGSTISLVTAKAGDVSVDVYSMSGRRIATLFHGTLTQGSYAFSLENMPKGMYIVRVKGAGISSTQPALVK
jgi:hypothetical protein